MSYDRDRIRIYREQIQEELQNAPPPWRYAIDWQTLSRAVRNAIDIKEVGEHFWQQFKDELLSRLWDGDRLTRLEQQNDDHREHTYREGNGDELERDLSKLLTCPPDAVKAVLIQEHFPNSRRIVLETLEEFGIQARAALAPQRRRAERGIE